MITQWDIISRIDPKTKVVRYTLVTDGSEADARIVLKKLKGQVSAIKKALPPFVYAFRLHNDLDENTLENIRTAMREVIEQTAQLGRFTGSTGTAGNTLFGGVNENTIHITPEKPAAEPIPASGGKAIELDLEDATIISSKRIFGKGENPPPPSAESVSAQRYEENVKNPTLPVVDMMTPAPQEAQTGTNASMPVLPENTFAGSGKTGNKGDLVALDATQMDLPDIEPDPEKKASKLSSWFHHKKKETQDTPKKGKNVRQPAKETPRAKAEPAMPSIPAEEPAPAFEMAPMPEIDLTLPAKTETDVVPLQERQDKILATQNKPLPTQKDFQPQPQEPLQAAPQAAPEPVQMPEPETAPAPQAELEPVQTQPVPAEQPVTPKEERIIKVAPRAAAAPHRVPQPHQNSAETDGDFPQINVQVRPVVFEDETKTENVAQAQADKTAQDLPAPQAEPEPVKTQTIPAQEQTAQAEPEPVKTQTIQPQAQVEQPQPEPVQTPAEQAEPEPVKTQTIPAQEQTATVPLAEEKDVTEEEQISLHPLNISLEDMFLAETKYDMFVDVNEPETPTGDQQKTSPAPKSEVKSAPKQEPKVQAEPKTEPKAQEAQQKPAPEKQTQEPAPKPAAKPAPAKKAPLPPPPPVIKPKSSLPRKVIKRPSQKDTL